MVAAVGLATFTTLALVREGATGDGSLMSVIAAQIREQGYACDSPQSATRGLLRSAVLCISARPSKIGRHSP
jgi:hypothetical protein